MVGLANGAEQAVASTEAVVGGIAGESVDRRAGMDASGKTVSHAAGAATAVAPNPRRGGHGRQASRVGSAERSAESVTAHH